MTQRIFIIGGEWIYFKIYSGPKTMPTDGFLSILVTR